MYRHKRSDPKSLTCSTYACTLGVKQQNTWNGTKIWAAAHLKNICMSESLLYDVNNTLKMKYLIKKSEKCNSPD